MSDHREIPLTHGLAAIVDAEDYEMLAARKWYVDFRRWGGYVRASFVHGFGRLVFFPQVRP